MPRIRPEPQFRAKGVRRRQQVSCQRYIKIARLIRTPKSTGGWVVVSPRRSWITATDRSLRFARRGLSAAASAVTKVWGPPPSHPDHGQRPMLKAVGISRLKAGFGEPVALPSATPSAASTSQTARSGAKLPQSPRSTTLASALKQRLPG